MKNLNTLLSNLNNRQALIHNKYINCTIENPKVTYDDKKENILSISFVLTGTTFDSASQTDIKVFEEFTYRGDGIPNLINRLVNIIDVFTIEHNSKQVNAKDKIPTNIQYSTVESIFEAFNKLDCKIYLRAYIQNGIQKYQIG